MIEIMSLLIGLAAGVVAGSAVVYLLPYQGLRRKYERVRTLLAEFQSKNNELQANLLDAQSAAYQNHQAMAQQQKRFEDQLAETGERYAEQEKRFAELEAQRAQEQQVFLREATRLRGAISRLEQEQVALQDRYAQEGARWDRERQSLKLETEQMEAQIRELRQDKAGLEARLEQQNETWERERLALQIQMNTLEDNLELQKARSSHGGAASAPDSALLAEKLQADAELKRRQAVWDEERQTLQEQMERLQAERRALREQTATASPFMPVVVGELELRQQLEQTQRDRQALEEKLAARELRAEQERSALETEIEQLMERLLRLQREREA